MYEIKPHGILESIHKPSNLVAAHIRKELEFMFKKNKVILPASYLDDDGKKTESSDVPASQNSMNYSGSTDHELLRQ